MAKAATGQLILRASGWYARITTTIEGERIRVSRALGTHNKAVARRRLEKLLAADNPAAEDIARAETFSEAAERIYEAKKIARPAWAKQGLAWLRAYAVPDLGRIAVASITTAQINAVLEHAQAKGLSRQSVKHLKQHLSNVFKALRMDGTIIANPVDVASMPDFASAIVKERAVLTDAELAVYLAYEPADGRAKGATLERQTMACVARMFGGLRTGDLHALRWEAFDTEAGAFEWGYAPRQKTRRPQLLEVPSMLRPILRDWWKRAGKPSQGFLFPSRRGERAGEAKQSTSHAAGFRRDLQAAFKLAIKRGVTAPAKDSQRWRELFVEGEYTLPIDFHSLRRGYAQALADADVNAQQAAALTGHSDMAAHMRYLRNAGKMRKLPEAALPRITIVLNRHTPFGSDSESPRFSGSQSDEKHPETSEIVLAATGTDSLRKPLLYPAELQEPNKRAAFVA